MEVARDIVFETLRRVGSMDHEVLYKASRELRGPGFTTEYAIQRAIMFNWSETPFGRTMRLIGDEIPVDGGRTSRRIDLLAEDKRTGDIAVIELKRAEAPPSVVDQVVGYLDVLGSTRMYPAARLTGIIVAERIPVVVRDAAKRAGVAAFEIEWPLSFRQVV